ncbi:MAG: thiolase family protein [Pelotomaculum sp.]|nr:thiolase family protein [Pelotomaculum sp.]
MANAVIVGGVRTAIGRIGGTLKNVQAEELAAHVIGEILKRTEVEGREVDEVILGQAKQSCDAPNIARVSSLMAGLPIEVPAYTVHRQCGSGLQALINAAQQIRLNESGIIVAGGVESMSTAPYYLRFARYGYGAGNGEILDPNTESQPRSQPESCYGRLTMGMTAENLAVKYSISRAEQDEFALWSQEKAWAAIESGRFRPEITPFTVDLGKGKSTVFDTDEHPRKTSLEALSKLKPAFKENGTVTAGNSSGRNDGAAAVVMMAEEKARERGLFPYFRVVSYAASAVSPEIMGIGPVYATRRALDRAGLRLEDIDLIELNEAFAAQSLAVLRELQPDRKRVNVNGGAIALGHPLGMSGARLVVTLIHEMVRRDSRYGLATLCIAGGQGLAMIVEKVKN